MINRTMKKLDCGKSEFFSQHFGMFNSMLENMIAVQKELVLERTYYMDDKMAYFMNKLIDEDDINSFNDEKFRLEQKYAAMFGHGVPREMFPPCISKDEIIKAVESCVQNQKDELMKILDAGGVSWLSV